MLEQHSMNPEVIPKIIHYVWVGTAPKTELALRCIASWKKFLPDYEIIEWNNERFAALNNRYAQEAFAAKNGLLCQISCVFMRSGKWADFILIPT